VVLVPSASCNELEESDHALAEWDMAVALSTSCTSSKSQITHSLRVEHGSDSVSIVYELEESDHALAEGGTWH